LMKRSSAAAALAQATKPYRPTGGGGGGGAKGYDALAQAIYDAQMDPNNPAKQAKAQAFIKAANLYGKQPGDARTETALSGQDITLADKVNAAKAKAREELKFTNKDYNRASSEEKKRLEIESDKRVEQGFPALRTMQRNGAPGARSTIAAPTVSNWSQ